jgi:hypothetical protein
MLQSERGQEAGRRAEANQPAQGSQAQAHTQGATHPATNGRQTQLPPSAGVGTRDKQHRPTQTGPTHNVPGKKPPERQRPKAKHHEHCQGKKAEHQHPKKPAKNRQTPSTLERRRHTLKETKPTNGLNQERKGKQQGYGKNTRHGPPRPRVPPRTQPKTRTLSGQHNKERKDPKRGQTVSSKTRSPRDPLYRPPAPPARTPGQTKTSCPKATHKLPQVHQAHQVHQNPPLRTPTTRAGPGQATRHTTRKHQDPPHPGVQHKVET